MPYICYQRVEGITYVVIVAVTLEVVVGVVVTVEVASIQPQILLATLLAVDSRLLKIDDF